MRVLIPLDGSQLSDRVLEALAPWVKRWGAEVDLLTVLDPRDAHEVVAEAGRSPAGAAGFTASLASRGAAVEPPPAVVIDRGQALEALRVNTEDELRGKAAGHLRGAAVKVHADFAEHAADGIAAFVREHDIDFVAMGTHGRSGVGQAVLGSVAGAVVRHAPVPVILVGPDATVATAEVIEPMDS
ncbi:MAG: hypothetical protein C0506_10630 [Anaerolinea sp.]|nr:hypothetical protein [Anaerolinea sp.]